MNSLDAIRFRIKSLMVERNINWNALCLKCGLSPSSLKSIFYKRAKSTTIHTINLICDGLGICIKDFFNYDIFENIYDL